MKNINVQKKKDSFYNSVKKIRMTEQGKKCMKLRNVLIVVKDIEKSKKFYHDLFGLDTILDNDGNVVMTEGARPSGRKNLEKLSGKRSHSGK